MRRSLISYIGHSVSRRSPTAFQELAAATFIEGRESSHPQFTCRASWIGDWWFTSMSSRDRIDCSPDACVSPPMNYAMLILSEGPCPETMQSAPLGRPGAITLMRWTDSWKIANSARFNLFGVYFPAHDLEHLDTLVPVEYGRNLSSHMGAGAVLAASLRALASTSEASASSDRSLRALLPGMAQFIRTAMAQTEPVGDLSERSQRRHRVIDYLEAHYSDSTLCSDEVAVACGMSRRQLYREFFAGESFADVLRRLRVEKATSRLSSSPHVSITQVAFDSGFASTDTFSHCFRAIHGYSPRDYRARMARGVA
jgi:AraC-like DNA-binding protein